jgi:hypothetical protein
MSRKFTNYLPEVHSERNPKPDVLSAALGFLFLWLRRDLEDSIDRDQ